MRTRAQGDAVGVDTAYIASTFDVAESDVQTLLDHPTTELVKDFLRSIVTKSQDYDALKAEKLKVDVELENTVRTTDTKLKAQKATVTRNAKEIEELRQKLNESEAARETLASEIEQVRSSTSGSTVETQTLRQRIETLEASNRDALALVESKSTEKDRVATELSEQHSKLLALRREISQLEQRNQSLENSASSQKFKEQTLQQEIDLLKKNNEWHSTELQTRSQEHAKFRKERNARISNLELELEDSNATVDALKRAETTLRQRLDEVQAKADEAFARIASLQEEAARKEQGFKAELDGSKRLAELQAQNAATHKARLQEVQAQVDQIKDDAADEIGRLQAEIETERGDKEDAERKVAELEIAVERLEQQTRASRPGTPIRNGALEPHTPGRLGSRAGSPAMPGSMRKTVGGLSFTQLYTNFTECQEELEAERRRTSKLSTAMDELISELETRRPELEDMRAEQERLESEILNFSGLLDDANDNRDGAVREAQRWQGEAEAAAREGQILRQQLRDLSAQVKILLVEIQSRDSGLGELSADERLQLERAARGELDDGSLDDMTSTGHLISERLVIFRDVSDLQAQNEKLLRLTRELGEQMEGEEAREKARQSAADAQEVDELRQQIGRYKDELQATATQIDSYMKERDMFRRMLQHRGQLAPDADLQSMFGQSVMAPGTPQRNSGAAPPATPRTKDAEDYQKLLKEQQNYFDQYREETSIDRRQLKEQVDALAREKSTLQADIARAQSQITLATERYEMLNSNFTAARNENTELQKRSQQLAEQAAKQDLRTQQVAEELVEARSMTDSLRNENANAKAERELWKRIEARLTEDNKALMDERSRLNKIVIDLQNLQNERELTESENRRRTQSRIESLEVELTSAKKKLESEVEESRKASLRREYEEGQSRTRIDDLVKSLGNVREELVAAKTTRDQLQSRVDEMKIELRAAEEKVTALQPRPTPRAEPSQQGEQTNDGSDELPAEQRLAVEVSDLRRDLEMSRTELENAKQQVQQFRSIAQATEEELGNLTQTADQYKEDIDQVLVEKDAKIKELEQRIEDLSAELTTSNKELSEIRTKADESSRELAEQHASFESELARLRDDAKGHAEEKKLFQQDIKAQAEIAQQAQQAYDSELFKHAEAAKSLQSVRKEYNELRTEVAGIKAEAEAAKVNLERGEESWGEQRERFEREIEDAKRRRQDVDEQNKLLHTQMESFSTELAALRAGRAAAADDGAREETHSSSSNGNNLQEVIKFLRREKEIVDVQYELSIQEAKRLQQQLDYANTQLEEARQKLVDERRQNADKANNEGSTNKLAQTIGELNLFRESATTLRNEARVSREKLEEKTKELENLFAELEPLKGRVGELEGELESKEGELKLLQDDRDHWRERTQNIISKYDRVDPAQLEELNKQLEDLKAEKARLEAEQAPLREQVDGFDAKLEDELATARTGFEERIARFKQQAKDQDKKRREEITNANSNLTQANADLSTARAELEETQTKLNETSAALEEARSNAAKAQAEGAEEGELEESGADQEAERAALQTRVDDAEVRAQEQQSRADALNVEVQRLQGRVQELESQITTLQQQLEAANATREGEQSSASTSDSETLAKLQQELATAQQEVETLRASAQSESAEPVANAEPAAGDKSVADQIATEVARLRQELEAQHALALTQMEEANKQKMEKHTSNLRRQLTDGRAKQRSEAEAELSVKHSEEIQQLKAEHQAAVERLQAEHKAELEKLSKEGAAAVDQATASPAVKSEAAKADTAVESLDLSEAQAKTLIKNNAVIKEILKQNIISQIDKQTAKLKAIIAERDEEISKLKTALDNASQASAGNTDDSDKISKEELARQLEAAKVDKEAAVRQATENAEKKAKVQLSMRDLFQAKINAVKVAVSETPDKPVKEVWAVADKARPTPAAAKPVPATPSTPAAASTTNGMPPASSSPAQTQAPTATAQTAQPGPQDKLKARAERFGTGDASATTNSSAPSFGQPSAPFGVSQSTGSPNPQAAAFTPGNAAPAQPQSRVPQPNVRASVSNIPQPGSNLPRAASRPPSRQASNSTAGNGFQFQGAAAQKPAGGPQRGGHQASGLPRGGAARGNFGAPGRGGPAHAGQKRSHEGGDGGDGKRSRGGGPTGGSS
jgi:nucleoprotein TPR